MNTDEKAIVFDAAIAHLERELLFYRQLDPAFQTPRHFDSLLDSFRYYYADPALAISPLLPIRELTEKGAFDLLAHLKRLRAELDKPLSAPEISERLHLTVGQVYKLLAAGKVEPTEAGVLRYLPKPAKRRRQPGRVKRIADARTNRWRTENNV